MENLKEIQDKILELQIKAQEIIQAERLPIIKKMKEHIETYGITAFELGFEKSLDKKPLVIEENTSKKPIAPKYRLGDSTWSGRGKSPKWMVEYLKSGGLKDNLLINKIHG